MADQGQEFGQQARLNFVGPWRCRGGRSWWRAIRIESFADAAAVQRSNGRSGHLVAPIGALCFVKGPQVDAE